MTAMGRLACIITAAAVLSACGAHDREETTHLYPLSIEMRDAPGMDNRHDFEITGPDWESAHVEVGDEVWNAGPAGLIYGDQIVGLALDEPAPYTRKTPINLHATFRWDARDELPPDELLVEAQGVLESTTDPGREPVVLFSTSEVIAADSSGTTVGFSRLEVLTDDLPERVDLWRLTIDWKLTPRRGGEPVEAASEIETIHRIPTSWRGPTSDVRLYRETVLWGSMWAAGQWRDEGEARQASAHEISRRLMEGVGTLGDYGFEYGTFDRPPKDKIEDRANVFLDLERSACGEFRGILMNLIEYHGVEASWVWWRKSHDDERRLGIYKTRKLPAVGREAKHWWNTNHIVVEVAGQIYDPTYTVHKPSFEAYEDWMFVKYCRRAPDFCSGECDMDADEERRHCISNPPGLKEGDFEVVRGSNYR